MRGLIIDDAARTNGAGGSPALGLLGTIRYALAEAGDGTGARSRSAELAGTTSTGTVAP